MKRIVGFLIAFCVSLSAFAVTDQYQFAAPQYAKRFTQLTEELRCLVCQNQNLADSHAPLAQDLRQKIAGMMSEGKSDAQIIDYLVQRYGEFVLYRPFFTMKTALLWLGPFLLLVLSAGILGVVILKHRKRELKV